MEVLAVWSGLMVTIATLGYGMTRFTSWDPAPAETPAAVDTDSLVWTAEGLLDFFQTNDAMTGDQYRKFEAIIMDLNTVKPRVRVKAVSRQIAAMPQNIAADSVEPVAATLTAETAATRTSDSRMAFCGYLVRYHAAGLFAVAVLLMIGSSNAVAGLALRATLAIIPLWSGLITEQTFTDFCLSYVINFGFGGY